MFCFPMECEPFACGTTEQCAIYLHNKIPTFRKRELARGPGEYCMKAYIQCMYLYLYTRTYIYLPSEEVTRSTQEFHSFCQWTVYIYIYMWLYVCNIYVIYICIHATRTIHAKKKKWYLYDLVVLQHKGPVTSIRNQKFTWLYQQQTKSKSNQTTLSLLKLTTSNVLQVKANIAQQKSLWQLKLPPRHR